MNEKPCTEYLFLRALDFIVSIGTLGTRGNSENLT